MIASRLNSLETRYKKIGFELDFSSIERYKSENVEYYNSLLLRLDEIYQIVCQVHESALDPHQEFRFKITLNYDKRFYCAAKIADNAKSLYHEPLYESYYVSYTGDQIDEIRYSYEVLCTPFNVERSDMIKAREYLMQHSPSFRLETELYSMCKYPSGEQIPWFGQWPSYPIINQLRNLKKSVINGLYSEMKSEKRMPTKWCSEFKLFSYVKLYCPEALYQYRCDWLGYQSFDIFLPKQFIAIEYQGEQHYKDDSFYSSSNAKERDERKRRISNENGIKIAYFSYKRRISRETVLTFLGENDINVVPIDLQGREIDTECPGLFIAPIIEHNELIHNRTNFSASKRKPKTERNQNNYRICQYDREGKFINSYNNYHDAETACGITKKAISKAIYGERKTSGGFQWRKISTFEPITDIQPITEAANLGIAKAVVQVSFEGEYIAEYASISQAANATGINIKSISCAIRGIQKQAGGYYWHYSNKT